MSAFERALTTLLGGKSTKWHDWTPTFPGATMTYTAVTVDHARFCLRGKVCHYYLRASGTLGGTAANNVEFTLPDTMKTSSGTAGIAPTIGTAYVSDGTGTQGFVDALQGGATARVYRANLANFTLGAASVISACGTFEIE